MHNRLCDMFGIEVPIFAFSHCRDVVVEVSRAKRGQTLVCCPAMNLHHSRSERSAMRRCSSSQ